MASDIPSEIQNLDLCLLLDGAVTLYFRRELLEADAAWLRAHAYNAVVFDCLGWSDVPTMHRALAAGLQFPDYYGMGLDALNDCMKDVEIPSEGGLAIIFLRFDAFAAWHAEVAHGVLDILADTSRRCLLSGRRLIVLAQSDDPWISIAPAGATTVRWNRFEWLNK